MKGKFLMKGAREIDKAEWGPMEWISRPSTTKAEGILAIIVDLAVGGFHDFHYHPGQEEVIYVLKGKIEQWIEGEMKMLKPGDAVFLDADTVHASFNAGKSVAQMFVVVSPCRGKAGYRAVDVSKKAPWKGLRKP